MTVQGIEHIYSVKDMNFDRMNKWTFAIRVPNNPRGGIIVQPVQVPSKNVWAGLERRSLVLPKATRNPYRRFVYCKVNLADPSGRQNYVGTRIGERDFLPTWLQELRWRMRLKRTVATTAGYSTAAPQLAA